MNALHAPQTARSRAGCFSRWARIRPCSHFSCRETGIRWITTLAHQSCCLVCCIKHLCPLQSVSSCLLACSTNPRVDDDYSLADCLILTDIRMLASLVVFAALAALAQGMITVNCKRNYLTLARVLSASCPSCFPTCQSMALTAVPICINPTFDGTWYEGSTLFEYELLSIRSCLQGFEWQLRHLDRKRHFCRPGQLDITVFSASVQHVAQAILSVSGR
jgi:hypothetical protein